MTLPLLTLQTDLSMGDPAAVNLVLLLVAIGFIWRVSRDLDSMRSQFNA